jgi:hypothetical protein
VEGGGGGFLRPEAFDTGDYMGAVREKMQSETISKVLYPSDDKEQGNGPSAAAVLLTSCSSGHDPNTFAAEGGSKSSTTSGACS